MPIPLGLKISAQPDNISCIAVNYMGLRQQRRCGNGGGSSSSSSSSTRRSQHERRSCITTAATSHRSAVHTAACGFRKTRSRRNALIFGLDSPIQRSRRRSLNLQNDNLAIWFKAASAVIKEPTTFPYPSTSHRRRGQSWSFETSSYMAAAPRARDGARRR
jgi:hypothetical protein